MTDPTPETPPPLPVLEGVLSVVIPVYDEEATVEELVGRVRRRAGVPVEIIVVDDASTDGSRVILDRLQRGGAIDQLILQPENRGKGAALRRGFEVARGEWVIVQDADLEYDPADYAALLAPILDDRADVVYGSRFVGSEAHRVLLFWHSVGNRFLTLLSNMLTNLNLTDMETCYKLFRREVIQGLDLREDRFGIEPEITAKIAKIPGIRIYEVGISYAGRSYEEGKKISWRDGFRALYCILRYRIGS